MSYLSKMNSLYELNRPDCRCNNSARAIDKNEPKRNDFSRTSLHFVRLPRSRKPLLQVCKATRYIYITCSLPCYNSLFIHTIPYFPSLAFLSCKKSTLKWCYTRESNDLGLESCSRLTSTGTEPLLHNDGYASKGDDCVNCAHGMLLDQRI